MKNINLAPLIKIVKKFRNFVRESSLNKNCAFLTIYQNPQEDIMNKIILVVEDKKEEQLIAKKVVLDSGNKVIIADTLNKAETFIEKFSEKLSGIITDIHFPIDSARENASGANGISIVITSLRHDVPCAVRTDDVAHGASYIPLILKRLEILAEREIPISGTKDWNKTLQQLTHILEEKS